MDKKKCAEGKKLDILVGVCFPRDEPGSQTDPPMVVPSPVRGRADTLGLSPALCAVVVLVTVGSIVALAVWLIIYRRQTRLGSGPVDPEAAHEPLQKTEPRATILPPLSKTNSPAEMCSLAAAAPAPCPHLYPGTHLGWNQEQGLAPCRGPTAQSNGCTVLPVCSTAREHKLPLPATELGGTALVTTKTV